MTRSLGRGTPTRALLTCLTLIATFAITGSAAAASNPITVFHGQTCQLSNEGTFTTCTSGTSVFLVTETPSGNISITDEARTVITFTSADGCSTTVARAVHFHTLLKTGSDAAFEHQALTDQVVTSQGAACGFPPFICTSSEHFHLANSTFQYDRFDSVCEPL